MKVWWNMTTTNSFDRISYLHMFQPQLFSLLYTRSSFTWRQRFPFLSWKTSRISSISGSLSCLHTNKQSKKCSHENYSFRAAVSCSCLDTFGPEVALDHVALKPRNPVHCYVMNYVMNFYQNKQTSQEMSHKLSQKSN